MRVGTGKANLDFPDGHGLFGYSVVGGRGYNAAQGSEGFDQLQVRALYLENGGSRLLVVTYDLSAGSRLLQRALLDDLRKEGFDLSPAELWVAGTHTHAGPGHYLGNLYDVFGQWPWGFRPGVFSELRTKGLVAAKQALSSARNAKVGIADGHVWAGANRSLNAFLANFSGGLPEWEKKLGLTPPPDLHPEERAIDPRLRVVAFVDEQGENLASWATYCCHPATTPPKCRRTYHRDWPGFAVDKLESGVPFAMLNMGANGDVSALPRGHQTIPDPLSRISDIGTKVSAVWQATHHKAREQSADVEMELGFWRFVPREWDLPAWDIGVQIALAPEIHPPKILRCLVGCLKWCLRGAKQRPKFSVGGPLTRVIAWLLRCVNPSPEHPIWLLRLGSHLFYAAPFEQTTYAAHEIECQLVKHWRETRGQTITASPLGLIGDYAGYVTTRKEYRFQRYEGAHTLYGGDQHETMIRAWQKMITKGPLLLDGRNAIDDARLSERLRQL